MLLLIPAACGPLAYRFAVRDAIRGSNMDVGGRTVELSEFEFIVRGRGYVKSVEDLSQVVLKVENGTPVTLADVARIERARTSGAVSRSLTARAKWRAASLCSALAKTRST